MNRAPTVLRAFWGCLSIFRAYSPSKGEKYMCYNCGCQMPDDDMGNPKNITNKTFQEAAAVSEQTVEEARKNALELLQKVVEKKPQ